MVKIFTVIFFFRVHDGSREICLGEKLRGFLKGTIKPFGGKSEKEETIGECALREGSQESGVYDLILQKVGEVIFFEPALNIVLHVFKALSWTGEPHKTDPDGKGPEIDPSWYDIRDIPYNQMEVADQYWMVPLLKGQKFIASVHCDATHHLLQNVDIKLLPNEYVFE